MKKTVFNKVIAATNIETFSADEMNLIIDKVDKYVTGAVELTFTATDGCNDILTGKFMSSFDRLSSLLPICIKWEEGEEVFIKHREKMELVFNGSKMEVEEIEDVYDCIIEAVHDTFRVLGDNSRALPKLGAIVQVAKFIGFNEESNNDIDSIVIKRDNKVRYLIEEPTNNGVCFGVKSDADHCIKRNIISKDQVIDKIKELLNEGRYVFVVDHICGEKELYV